VGGVGAGRLHANLVQHEDLPVILLTGIPGSDSSANRSAWLRKNSMRFGNTAFCLVTAFVASLNLPTTSRHASRIKRTIVPLV